MPEDVRWGSMLIPIILAAAVSGGASFIARSMIEAEHFGYLDTQVKANRDAITDLRAQLVLMDRFIRETRDTFVLPNAAKIQELAAAMGDLRASYKNQDVILYRIDTHEKAISDLRTQREVYAQIIHDMQEDLAAMRRMWEQQFPEDDRKRPGGPQR